jgi:hypothetical protein
MDIFKNNVLSKGDPERRTTKRFHIEQEVRYKLLYEDRAAEMGCGATVNVSSGGLWFTTDHLLITGTEVELAMNWPVLLNGSCPLKLVIFGWILRSTDRGAAVAIERYEFRTQSMRALRDGLPMHSNLAATFGRKRVPA